jgi:small subunit ribosomal protein S15e
MDLMNCRARRRFTRGLKRKPMALVKKLRKAKKEAPPNEKPEVVKTHLRNMIIVPEMVGSIVGVYNGKTFNQVEVKVCLKSLSMFQPLNYLIFCSLK